MVSFWKMMSEEMNTGSGRPSHAVSKVRGWSWLHTLSKKAPLPLNTAMHVYAYAALRSRFIFTTHLLLLHFFGSGHLHYP